MPQPTVNDVHVDQLLSNVAISYRNTDYVADQHFPVVPVNKQSNVYASFDQSAWFRDEAAQRSPGTLARVSGYPVTTSNQYYCHNYALSKSIPDEVRENEDSVMQSDRRAVEFVSDKLMLQRERKFVTDFFTTSVWGTDKTGGSDFTVWSNYAGSSPLTDFEGWMETVEGKIAKTPVQFTIGREVWTQLKWHPDVVDSIKYTQKGLASVDLVASLFGIGKILIGKSLVTTDKEGTAEASVTYSRVWGKHGLLLYVPTAPALDEPAAGYTFVWNRPGKPGLMTTYRFRDDRARTDYFEVETFYDQKLTSSNAGLFVS